VRCSGPGFLTRRESLGKAWSLAPVDPRTAARRGRWTSAGRRFRSRCRVTRWPAPARVRRSTADSQGSPPSGPRRPGARSPHPVPEAGPGVTKEHQRRRPSLQNVTPDRPRTGCEIIAPATGAGA
jgi:hypothetical protein